MSTIVLRSVKGSPLTNAEVDANFSNLNTDKVEKTAAAITGGSINNTTVGATTANTGNFTVLTENGSPAVVQTDIGTAPNEIPLNQYLGNLAYQDAANIAGPVGVGGALSAAGGYNGTVGATTPNTGAFTTLTTSGNVTLGDAATDTVTVNGYMGVGGAPAPTAALNVVSTALTGTAQYGVVGNITGSSAATSQINAVYGGARTAAAAFTSTAVSGLRVANAVKGAGSTITNLHGAYIEDQTQGTSNFGITSLVSSGTNKWNIYASGTAANYFAGNVQFAAGSAAAPALTRFGDDNTGIFFPAADTIAFAEGGVEAMRIDSSGNLGLGVTPSAWGAVFTGKVLEINNDTTNGYITGATDESFHFGNNGFYDTAWKYKTTGLAATNYFQQNGQHIWRTAPSGTAGGAISFTQAMTLNASGNLGIGTSSPEQKLEVVGPSGGEYFRAGGGSVAPRRLTFSSFDAGASDVGHRITAQGGTTTPGVIAFDTGNATTVTERLRIDGIGNVGIGTSSPSASAILDAQSTTKGVRMPNMTTTQKNAIASPAAGLMVFDTTLAKLCVYSGAAWETITSL
jgi:hypothetical protein